MKLTEWDDIPPIALARSPLGSYQGPPTPISKVEDQSPIGFKKKLGKYALKGSRKFKLDFGKLQKAASINQEEDLMAKLVAPMVEQLGEVLHATRLSRQKATKRQ
jgi:hypothetical protein